MSLRDELAKMFAAEIGPPVGNPEWLAKHGARLAERNRKTAERWADLSVKVFSAWLGSEEAAKLHAKAATDNLMKRMPPGATVTLTGGDVEIAHEILSALAAGTNFTPQ